MPALGVALLAGVCAFLAHTGDGWVPILDGANLLFHEAGHPLFGLVLGERGGVYGGTLGQLVFPLVATIAFRKRGETVSCAAAMVWGCENLWNIARYLADARAQLLPLVGGGEHDWTEILTRWGLLRQDLLIAGVVRAAGWIGMIAVLVWLWMRWREDRDGG